MPLQVQNQIDGIAERVAVVSVPNTGETITASALADTAVALGRRIEEVRASTVDPSKFYELVEDFDAVALGGTPGATNSGTGFIGKSGSWIFQTSGGGLAVSGLTADADHPGVLQPTVANALLAYPEGMKDALALDKLDRAAYLFYVGASSGALEVGFTGGTAPLIGTTAHSFTVRQSAGGNFILRTCNNSASTELDMGAAPNRPGWNRIDLFQLGGALSARVNGGATATAVGTLPTLTERLTPFIRQASIGTVPNGLYWDFISMRFAVTR